MRLLADMAVELAAGDLPELVFDDDAEAAVPVRVQVLGGDDSVELCFDSRFTLLAWVEKLANAYRVHYGPVPAGLPTVADPPGPVNAVDPPADNRGREASRAERIRFERVMDARS